jgi:nucleotidyltransferase/DNA polymerase involved in DNA repair
MAALPIGRRPGRTVTLKVKFADFQQITRSKSVADAIDSLADIERLSWTCPAKVESHPL